MSKQRYTLAQATSVANLVVEKFAPYCERIEIAGSIRRERAFVGDVEVLFIPKVRFKQGDMFSVGKGEVEDLANLRADELASDPAHDGWLKKRPSETGVFTWGLLNKLAIHKASGIPVDLFCEPNPANWFRSLVIRTGPRELNLKLIAEAAKRGLRLHAYGDALTKITTGEVVPCGSEEELFSLCGVPYLQPKDRV